jgi:sarcosine oxidase subunit beta
LLRKRIVLREPPERRRYEVVVIGGGAHGLATAYYLASRHGIRDVAVLERGYIGMGGSGRNTSVLRANYKAPQAVAFFKRSLELYEELAQELGFNLLKTSPGVLTLAHSEPTLQAQRERALLNAQLGVETAFVEPDEIERLCPALDLACGGNGRPVLGGSFHPAGACVRHDAVVWGYASKAQALGVHVYQGVEVTGLTIRGDRVTDVQTSSGTFSCSRVVCAVGGYVSEVAALAGLELPIQTHPLQAFVTEPYTPVINRLVASADMLVYFLQTTRGEVLVGAEIERYTSYSTRSTFTFLSEAAARCIQLVPAMRRMRILRQWTGVCDMTPDYSPILGPTPVDGFFLSSGWGTWGFKAVPAAGLELAQCVATGSLSPLIEPFALDRFRRDRLVPDRSSAGTH